jgi:hypothetical protein
VKKTSVPKAYSAGTQSFFVEYQEDARRVRVYIIAPISPTVDGS